jgi:hypothetical protein
MFPLRSRGYRKSRAPAKYDQVGASWLKCSSRSRYHHLIKTVWGWREQQLPDGTLILTSPAGHTFTTPGSALLVPSLCRSVCGMPSPEADPPPPPERCGDRAAMVPKRRRARAKERAYRVAAERQQNHQARTTRRAAAASSVGPATPDHDPPPF